MRLTLNQIRKAAADARLLAEGIHKHDRNASPARVLETFDALFMESVEEIAVANIRGETVEEFSLSA